MAIRSQSDGCACVHETGWLWPLLIAKRMHEWATSGAERRNTAVYGHAISLGAFRTVLGVGVDEAGSISWRSCTRRLVDLAARRLVGCRAVSSPAQWQRPRKWICARAPHRATKPSWVGDAHVGPKRTPGFRKKKVPAKKVITEKSRPRPGVCVFFAFGGCFFVFRALARKKNWLFFGGGMRKTGNFRSVWAVFFCAVLLFISRVARKIVGFFSSLFS